MGLIAIFRVNEIKTSRTPSEEEINFSTLADVYRSRLELEGFETREVHNAEDALSAAIEFKSDLVLLDAMMPKISGLDDYLVKSQGVIGDVIERVRHHLGMQAQ